jgi:DNA polymerase I
MPNKTLIVLDGNHLAYRAYYKFPNLKTFDGVNTSIVYGIPYITESLIRRLSPDRAIIAIDGGRSEYRKSLLPSYKEREQKLGFNRQDFYRQRKDALDIMKTLGIQVVGKKGFEADDLIAMLCRRYTDAGWKVIILSADKDFNQLIGIDVSVFNTGKGIMFTKENLYDQVGYEPCQCVDYLCLRGDKSDGIPGYPGMGEKKSKGFIKKFTSIRFFLHSPEIFGNVDKSKLKDIYTRNRHLIDLNYFYRKFLFKVPIPTENQIPEFSEIKLKKLCNIFETNSFLKPQFINTYKHLWERSIG